MTRNALRFGTCHFVTLAAAVEYYKPYGFKAIDVEAQVRDGTIAIGAPTIKAGQYLGVDADGRYWIRG